MNPKGPVSQKTGRKCSVTSKTCDQDHILCTVWKQASKWITVRCYNAKNAVGGFGPSLTDMLTVALTDFMWCPLFIYSSAVLDFFVVEPASKPASLTHHSPSWQLKYSRSTIWTMKSWSLRFATMALHWICLVFQSNKYEQFHTGQQQINSHLNHKLYCNKQTNNSKVVTRNNNFILDIFHQVIYIPLLRCFRRNYLFISAWSTLSELMAKPQQARTQKAPCIPRSNQIDAHGKRPIRGRLSTPPSNHDKVVTRWAGP